MQLAGVLLSGVKPILQPFLKLLLGRGGGQRGKIGIDSQVIAHGIALHHTAHPLNIGRLAIGLFARKGKPNLVAADGCQVATDDWGFTTG